MQAGHGGLEGVARVLAATGEALDEHQAQRVDVDGAVDRLAADLLGAQVRGGADDHAGGGDGRGVVDGGDPEVREVGAALGVEQHVAGLDVAVHHPAAVHVGERVGERGAQRDDVDDRQRPRTDPLRQRVALDELHDEVGAAVLVADVVDRHEPGVREPGEGEDLAPVAGLLALLDVADLLRGVGGIARGRVLRDDRAGGVEHLDGHVAAEELVAGPEHVRGAAAADEVADRVAAAHRRGRAGVGAHCPPSLPVRGRPVCDLRAPIIPYDRVPRLRDLPGRASPERRVAPRRAAAPRRHRGGDDRARPTWVLRTPRGRRYRTGWAVTPTRGGRAPSAAGPDAPRPGNVWPG